MHSVKKNESEKKYHNTQYLAGEVTKLIHKGVSGETARNQITNSDCTE